MQKVCWIDVETTGLDKVKQDVIQIAGIIDIAGVEQERFEFKCQPHNWGDVQQRALDVHGFSLDDLRSFPTAAETKAKVCAILESYVNKYDKTDKFVFAGYNSPFDYGFMEEWFKKAGDTYFKSFFKNAYGYHSELIDTYQDFIKYVRAVGTNLPNNKLVTAAAHFGIEFNAHDAMGDIDATRQIDTILQDMFRVGAVKYWAGANADTPA